MLTTITVTKNADDSDLFVVLSKSGVCVQLASLFPHFPLYDDDDESISPLPLLLTVSSFIFFKLFER